MVQRYNLNEPPPKTFAQLVAEANEKAKSSKTGAHGIKALGETGDIVWLRPDSTTVSVRDVDLNLEDARVRIEEAEQALVLTDERLEAAEGTVAGVRDELDGIDWENLDGAEVYTNGPPPANPTIGKALWVSPTGRVFRAVECEEQA